MKKYLAFALALVMMLIAALPVYAGDSPERPIKDLIVEATDKDGADILDEIRKAQDEYCDLFNVCRDFSDKMFTDATRAGVYEITQKNGSLLLFFRPEALEGAAACCAAPGYRGRIFLSAGEKPYITLKLRPTDDPLAQARALIDLYTEGKS